MYPRIFSPALSKHQNKPSRKELIDSINQKLLGVDSSNEASFNWARELYLKAVSDNLANSKTAMIMIDLAYKCKKYCFAKKISFVALERNQTATGIIPLFCDFIDQKYNRNNPRSDENKKLLLWAVDFFKEALTPNIADPEAVSKMLKTLIVFGSFSEAWTIYELALKKNFTNATVHADMMSLLAQLSAEFSWINKVYKIATKRGEVNPELTKDFNNYKKGIESSLFFKMPWWGDMQTSDNTPLPNDYKKYTPFS